MDIREKVSLMKKGKKDSVPGTYGALAGKVICIFLLGWLVFSQFGSQRVSRADFEEVASRTTAAADLSLMQKGDNQTIKRLYGLDSNNYEGLLLYYPLSNMGAEELLLVKLKDISQQEEVRTAVEARLQSQKDSFDGYGVDQFALLQKSLVLVQGNYVLYVVGADTGSVRQAFLGAL